MPAWLVWLIIAAALAIAEVTNFAFVLVMAAGGAVAASVAAGAGAPLAAQIVVAVVVTIGLVYLVRPPLLRRLHPEPAARTNADRLIGQDAVVLTPVNWQDGRVRLNGGEWSARTPDRGGLLPVGAIVTVVAIDGATAVVQMQPDFRKELG